MRYMILAQTSDGKVWVGDGVWRRQVADPSELQGLQWWIANVGGDSVVHKPWSDIRVLGRDVATLGA